jgi:hypothetical protein
LKALIHSQFIQLIQETILHHKALDCLFGLSPEVISEWSGLLVFFRHLESQFRELMEPCFNPIWLVIGRNAPRAPTEVWHWCFAVINAYKASSTPDPSIESIHNRLCHPKGQKRSEEEAKVLSANRECILQAIFAVLCWTSGTLTPLLGDRALQQQNLSKHVDQDMSDEVDANICLLAENCAHIYSASELRRPTSKMFYAYLGRSDENSGSASVKANSQSWENSRTSELIFEDMLHVSSLNYSSLSTIGGVRIKWVNVLTAHLAFNRAKRELSVYQFPSFCVAKILSQHRVDVLERYAIRRSDMEHGEY